MPYLRIRVRLAYAEVHSSPDLSATLYAQRPVVIAHQVSGRWQWFAPVNTGRMYLTGSRTYTSRAGAVRAGKRELSRFLASLPNNP